MASASTAAVSWAALVLAVAGLGIALTSGKARTGGVVETESEADLGDRASLENRLHDAETRLEAAERRIRDLEPRVAAAERSSATAAGEAARAVEMARGAGGGAGTVVEGGSAPLPATDAGRKAELEAILTSLRGGTFSRDSIFDLMTRARELGGLDEALREMEKYAASRATDPNVQVAMGTAYAAKLLSVPDGPERGQWAMKSLASYEAALKLDPEHWDAQFAKAFNLSRWPAFLGRQPEAIQTFERLIEQQERSPQDPRFAQTYFQLGNTYREAGNTDKALEVFRRGLQAFPGDQALRDQIQLLEKR